MLSCKLQSLTWNSDGQLETPRALSRFPVHPNDSGYLTSGSESASGPRSPGFIKSARSHHKVGSSQQHTALQNGPARRPGLAPLALNNERIRSNSESVLQATQSNRTKRMGIIPKKHTDLDALDESRVHRNSFHLRGQSHSSALRNVIQAADYTEEDANRSNNKQNGTFVRRLSSVPEQRQQISSGDDVIESAKGVLYSLHLVQPYLSSMVRLVKDNRSKRSSLDRYQRQASVQLGHLDQSLHDLSVTVNKSNNAKRAARKTVCKATRACIVVYGNIAGLLLENVKQLVVDGDPKYIRTLMLLLYGSLNEERNARRRLVSKRGAPKNSLGHLPDIQQSTKEPSTVTRDDALTPTQEHPKTGRRWVNDDDGHQSLNHTNLAAVLGSQRSPPVSSTASSRANSRSNSRVGFHYNSTTSSFVSTPKSGESFGGSLLVPRSRSGSVTVNLERSRQAQIEQDQFERIYITLNKAAEQGLQVIPYLEPRFLDNLERARKQYAPLEIRTLWTTIVSRTRLCGEMSDSLKRRLQHLKLNDTEARNAPDFWRLAVRFVDTYGNLLASLREARQLNQIDPDLRHRLRPVHKSTIEAGTLIKNSPWNKHTTESQPPSQIHSRAPTPVQNGYPPPQMQTQTMPPPVPNSNTANYQGPNHRRANGSNGSATGSTTSPYNTSVPATPLSAALGPAAQATVPSTPASGGGSMAGVFEGNVFQRADNLLLQGQTPVFRRQVGAP